VAVSRNHAQRLGARTVAWLVPTPLSRRRVAVRRIAERLAAMDSEGYDYDYQYERYLEHYLGGRDWLDEVDKMSTRGEDGTYYDARGPAPTWRQRLGAALATPRPPRRP
jgi:hypothetical protein